MKSYIFGVILGVMTVITTSVVCLILVVKLHVSSEIIYNRGGDRIVAKYNVFGDGEIWYMSSSGEEFKLLDVAFSDCNEKIIQIEFSDKRDKIGVLIGNSNRYDGKNRFVVFSKEMVVGNGKERTEWIQMLDVVDHIHYFCFSKENIFYRKDNIIGMVGLIDYSNRDASCLGN